MVFNLNIKNINDIICKTQPKAYATITGIAEYPNIKGMVTFYEAPYGVVVVANVNNLPETPTNIHGFHIHSGSSCTGNQIDPLLNVGEHYNPTNMQHPNHEGDLPPLFSNNGYAWLSTLTNRFVLKDVINKTVVIHLNPDDFTTQPSGNSGKKIACGVIKLF